MHVQSQPLKQDKQDWNIHLEQISATNYLTIRSV